MRFEKTGSYWKLPLYKKLWLNFKHWFKGNWKFLQVLANYQESVVGNELTILDALGLCHSLEEVKMGKTLRMIDDAD